MQRKLLFFYNTEIVFYSTTKLRYRNIARERTPRCSVCVYAFCMCIYIYIYACVPSRVHAYAFMCTRMCDRAFARSQSCMFTRAFAYADARVRMRVRAFVRSHVYVLEDV